MVQCGSLRFLRVAEHSQFLERDNFYLIKKLKKVDYFNMLRSILMIFIIEVALMYGIVTQGLLKIWTGHSHGFLLNPKLFKLAQQKFQHFYN